MSGGHASPDRRPGAGVQRDIDALRSLGDDAVRKKERTVQMMLQQLHVTDSAASRVEGLVSRLRESSHTVRTASPWTDGDYTYRTSYDSRVKQLEHELQVERDSRRLLLKDMQEQHTAATEKLAEQVMTLSNQLAEAKLANREAGDVLERETARADAAEEALAGASARADGLQAAADAHDAVAGALAAVTGKHAQDKEAFAAEVAERRVQLTGLEAAAAAMREERAALHRRALAELDTLELTDRDAVVFEEMAEYASLGAASKEMEMEVWRVMYYEKESQADDVEAELAEFKDALQEKGLELAEVKAQIAVLRGTVKQHEIDAAEHEGLRHVMAELEGTLRCSHAAAKECEARLNAAMADKGAQQKQLADQEQELATVRAEAGDFSGALDAARVEASVLNKQLAEAEERRDDALRKLDSKAQLAGQLQGLVDTLQAALKSSEERVKHEVSERRAAEADRDRVAEELRATQEVQHAWESRLVEEVASREAAENEAIAATQRLSAATREFETQATRLRTTAHLPTLSYDSLANLPPAAGGQGNPLVVPPRRGEALSGPPSAPRGSAYSSQGSDEYYRALGCPDSAQPDVTESVEVSNDTSSTISPSSSSTSSLNTSREEVDLVGVGAASVGNNSPVERRHGAGVSPGRPSTEPIPPVAPATRELRERAGAPGKVSPPRSRGSVDSGDGRPPNSSASSRRSLQQLVQGDDAAGVHGGAAPDHDFSSAEGALSTEEEAHPPMELDGNSAVSPITEDGDDFPAEAAAAARRGIAPLSPAVLPDPGASSSSHRSPRRPCDSPVSRPPLSPSASSTSLHQHAACLIPSEPAVVPGVYAHVKVQRDAQGEIGISHSGVDVVEVAGGSAAEKAGIRPGHRLLLINGRRVESRADVNSAFDSAPREYEITLQLPIDLHASG